MTGNSIQFVQISVDDLEKRLGNVIDEKITKIIDVMSHQKNSTDPELLTRKEAKNLLHKSYPYLWRLNKQGVLRSRKMGRSVYYYKQDIFDHLNKKQVA